MIVSLSRVICVSYLPKEGGNRNTRYTTELRVNMHIKTVKTQADRAKYYLDSQKVSVIIAFL